MIVCGATLLRVGLPRLLRVEWPRLNCQPSARRVRQGRLQFDFVRIYRGGCVDQFRRLCEGRRSGGLSGSIASAETSDLFESLECSRPFLVPPRTTSPSTSARPTHSST